MNFAIVGCGFIARKHAEAIANIPGAKLIAVCDKVQQTMNYYSETYGASMYQDFTEMLESEEIDIVNICTPSGFHSKLAIEAAEAHKHLVVEKPIAMTLEDADAIIRAANKHDVKLTVVHPNRFRPVVQELREIVDKGLLGKISHANCLVNWNRNQEYYDQAEWRGTKQHDGGVLMNQAIHNLDLLLWFMGEPEEVFSMEATRLRNIEAEDVSIGTIRFQSGALANVQVSTTVYPKNFEESITLFGETGTIKIGGSNALYFEHIEIEGMPEGEIQELKSEIQNNPWGTPGHQRVLEELISSIQNDENVTVSGEDGKNVLKLVLNFYESAKTKKLIKCISY